MARGASWLGKLESHIAVLNGRSLTLKAKSAQLSQAKGLRCLGQWYHWKGAHTPISDIHRWLKWAWWCLQSQYLEWGRRKEDVKFEFEANLGYIKRRGRGSLSISPVLRLAC